MGNVVGTIVPLWWIVMWVGTTIASFAVPASNACGFLRYRAALIAQLAAEDVPQLLLNCYLLVSIAVPKNEYSVYSSLSSLLSIIEITVKLIRYKMNPPADGARRTWKGGNPHLVGEARIRSGDHYVKTKDG